MMAGKKMFGVEEVREIKRNLIQRVPQGAIARWKGCSVETIARIARGETYREVEVEGEEVLRPELRGEGMPVTVLLGKTEEELNAEADESLRKLMEMMGANELPKEG